MAESLNSRPCENSLADFCTSALLKAWPSALLKAWPSAFFISWFLVLSEVRKCKSPLENIQMVLNLVDTNMPFKMEVFFYVGSKCVSDKSVSVRRCVRNTYLYFWKWRKFFWKVEFPFPVTEFKLFKNRPSQFLSHWKSAELVLCSEELSFFFFQK